MPDALALEVFAAIHNPWRARVHYVGPANSAVPTSGIIPFDTVDYDPGNNVVSLGTPTCGINIPVSGYYHVDVMAYATAYVANAMIIYQNATAYSLGPNVSSAISFGVSDTLLLNASDQVFAVSVNAITLATGVPKMYTYMSVCFVGFS